MCYSLEVSAGSFILSFLACAYIFYANRNIKTINAQVKKALSLFFIYVALMQLVDFFIWLDVDNSKKINQTMGVIGYWLNVLQPLVLLLLSRFFLTGYVTPIFDNRFIFTLSLLYFGFCVYKFVRYTKFSTVSRVNSEGNLNWAWNDYNSLFDFEFQYYIAFQVVVIFNYYYGNTVGMVTFALAYFLLGLSFWKFNKNIANIWCFFANLIPVVLIFL